jgi:hypothetical protein
MSDDTIVRIVTTIFGIVATEQKTQHNDESFGLDHTYEICMNICHSIFESFQKYQDSTTKYIHLPSYTGSLVSSSDLQAKRDRLLSDQDRMVVLTFYRRIWFRVIVLLISPPSFSRNISFFS